MCFAPAPPCPLPQALRLACRRLGVGLSRNVLIVHVAPQRMDWFEVQPLSPQCPRPAFNDARPAHLRARFVVSTSRFGIGQVKDTNRTPLGLHRVAVKAGAGWPAGTVFVERQPVGCTRQSRPDAAIAHRIFWLEGLEPGWNRGNPVDSFQRFIYIHGVGNELTLGRPASHGCVHLAAADLVPLHERLPVGTLVWIASA